jgi:hypothetical protein
MPYNKRVWQDRTVERPLTYTMQNNADGTVTLIPSEGSIITTGTPITADNLNNMEDGIATAQSLAESLDLYPKLTTTYGNAIRFENVDLDHFQQSGWFTIGGNATVNRPPMDSQNPAFVDGGWFYLEVISHHDQEAPDKWTIQIAHDFRRGSWIRRSWSQNGVTVWDAWRNLATDGKAVIAFEGSSASALGAQAWQRANFWHFPERYGINVDATGDLFDVPYDGYYLINMQGYINMQVSKGFYVEMWTIGESMADPSIISSWTPANGWNYFAGSRVKWLVKGKQYEFVWKHGDDGYSRNLSSLRGSISSI